MRKINIGLIGFGLGRLSLSNVSNKNIVNGQNTITENNLVENQNTSNDIVQTVPSVQSGEKRYVASKNGKMYYSLGCSGAKRIKPENEVYFSTKGDAEKSGYSFSSSCK